MISLPIPTTPPTCVDATFLNDCARCLRYCYYRHTMGLVPIRVSEALVFGLALHDAMHEWYSGDQTPDAATQAVLAIKNRYNEEDPENEIGQRGKRTCELAITRFLEYQERYKYDDIQPLPTPSGGMSETGWMVPFFDAGFLYGGRMDQPIRMSGGRLFIMDTKTGSGLGKYWETSFRPNLQVVGYVWGLGQLMGEKCFGLLVNGISSDKNPSMRFYRTLLTPTPPEIKNWTISVLGLIERWQQASQRAQETGEPLSSFFQEPGSCGRYGGCCYRHLCIGGINQPLIDSLYKVEHWEPFLADREDDD